MTISDHVRRLATPVRAALALLLLPALAAAQEAGNRWGPTPPASSFGHLFDELFLLITVLIGVSFLIVLWLLLVPMVRDRARPGHKAFYDHGSSLKDKRFTAIVSISVFIVLDAWVLVVAMRDLREGYWKVPPAAETKDLVTVQVLGQQWSWNFRMPGLDGAFGTADDVLTTNELVLPVDRPVSLNLTSKDVIHSLFLPDMRVKRDANPGAVNVAWFQPVKAGTYDILCAELCGFAHYQMHGKLRVLEKDEFETWHADASRLAAAAFDETDTEAQWAWVWKE